MRLICCGHSLIHVRQQKFFAQVADLGHDVVLFCPERWGDQRAMDYHHKTGRGSIAVKALPSVQVNLVAKVERGVGPVNVSLLDSFTLTGLLEHLENFAPDIVYVQQEPESALARQVIRFGGMSLIKHKRALFTWENLLEKPTDPLVVGIFDLVLCGNDAAQERMKRAGAKNTVILPQVGVDTAHFQARTQVERTIDVAYIGRPSPEKGVAQLLQAYPLAKVLEWVPYERLPWHYSQCKVVVCFSQDVPGQWMEQAMPFVSCEAMSSGCAVVVSDAGSIPFWHGGGFCASSPAVITPQDDTEGLGVVLRNLLQKDRLRNELADLGRPWVEQHLSSPVIAKRLIQAFEEVTHGSTAAGHQVP